MAFGWRVGRPGKMGAPPARAASRAAPRRRRAVARYVVQRSAPASTPSRHGGAVADALIFLAVGLAAGVLSGLFGIGGGVIIVPALIYLAPHGPH